MELLQQKTVQGSGAKSKQLKMLFKKHSKSVVRRRTEDKDRRSKGRPKDKEKTYSERGSPESKTLPTHLSAEHTQARTAVVGARTSGHGATVLT